MGKLWHSFFYGHTSKCIAILLYSTLLINWQPFINYFECTDIHKLIAPDLLHQVIKGTFKDHLMSWVEGYLVSKHGKHKASKILDDIN